MPNLSKTTRDHDVIRKWAEERGATPSHVKRTGSQDDVGVLRLDFPGYSGEGALEPISWEQFFEKFDEQNLALVYEEETAAGQKSNFNKLVNADSVEAAGAGRRQGRSGATRSRSPKKAAASKATRSSARPKSATKATGKKASSKNAASRKGAAQKSSNKAAAKKKSSGKKKASKKQVGSRKAVKKSAARRRR